MTCWAVKEMAGATVPSARALPNLAFVSNRIAEQPGLSLSAAAGHAGRQAASRLFSNPKTEVSGLLQGHVSRVSERCAGHSLVLAAQDTTVVDYSGHVATEGLGPISYRDSVQGLLAHSSLIMTPNGCPLGVGHLDIWARSLEKKGSAAERRKKPTEQKESYKWIRGLHATEQALAAYLDAGNRLLCIQDREGDIFDLLAAQRHPGTDLLIRAAHPRMVEVAGRSGRLDLFTAVANAEVAGECLVNIPRKEKSPARSATMVLRFQQVSVMPPQNGVKRPEAPPQIVTVIDARERPQKEGDKEISWTLLTTLPVTDAASAAKIVNYYTRRWLIERLHYTLKSGLQIERLQFDDAHTLSNALAVYWIVAWRTLHLTHVAREEPNSPANKVLEADELAVLEQTESAPVTTTQQAIIAIAKLGGYRPTKNGAPPGAKSLWIGMRKLEAMAEFYRLIKHRIS